MASEPLSDIGPGALSSLLAHAARHRPMALRCEECTDTASAPEGFDEDDHNCPQVACAGCSLKHADWAGDWEGYLRTECTVAWPCSVITTTASGRCHGGPNPAGPAPRCPACPGRVSSPKTDNGTSSL